MGASVAFEVKTVISVRMALYRIREATSGSYSPFTGSLSRISGPRHKARSLSLSLSLSKASASADSADSDNFLLLCLFIGTGVRCGASLEA